MPRGIDSGLEMNSFAKFLVLLMFIVLPVPVAHAVLTYVADMEVRVQDSISVSRIWARPGLIRMSVSSGRAFSDVIADYDQGRAWALAPMAGKYQEFPVKVLSSQIPHFFDPALRIDKRGLPLREEIDGHRAVRYQVYIEQPGGRKYQGLLWEAEALPGYPLRWEDAEQKLTAHWKNAVLTEISEHIFLIPDYYTEQKGDVVGAPARSGCRERPPR